MNIIRPMDGTYWLQTLSIQLAYILDELKKMNALLERHLEVGDAAGGNR